MKLMIALTTINLIFSGATLTVVLVGAKRAEKELENVKYRTNETVDQVKAAVSQIPRF